MMRRKEFKTEGWRRSDGSALPLLLFNLFINSGATRTNKQLKISSFSSPAGSRDGFPPSDTPLLNRRPSDDVSAPSALIGRPRPLPPPLSFTAAADGSRQLLLDTCCHGDDTWRENHQQKAKKRCQTSIMSSAVLQNFLRCRSSFSRQTFLRVPSLTETSAASEQMFSVSLRRQTSSSSSSNNNNNNNNNISIDRQQIWDSFGIWDNRIEEPILLPASIKYGKLIPQVSLSRVGSASVLGLRKQNEDRLRVARIHDNLLYFAVFDGHGGAQAADFCCSFMEKFIRDALQEDDDLETVLKKAFLSADEALLAHLSYFNNASFMTAGTTATVAMLRDGVELAVGSVGDSRALLCRKGRAMKLTKDHTPERKDERLRIQSFGGFVSWNSVGQANVNGRLCMTRSIGDFHLKTSGVIAEPDTRRFTVQHNNDSFLTLTTDGINFLLSDQEICDVINQCQNPSEAADVIAQQALQYGSEDNSSIIIVPLGSWGKHQSFTSSYSISRSFASSGRWS